MVVDDSGLERSFFYAGLPNESGISYCRAINAMKGMLSCTGDVQMIVVNQFGAVQCIVNCLPTGLSSVLLFPRPQGDASSVWQLVSTFAGRQQAYSPVDA